MSSDVRARVRAGFARRLLRVLWRVATTCMMAGMALSPFAPPPPPPPPPPVELREASGQQRARPGRRSRS